MKTFIQTIMLTALIATLGLSAEARSKGYAAASQYMKAGKAGHHKTKGKKTAKLKKADRSVASERSHKAKKKKKKKHRY